MLATLLGALGRDLRLLAALLEQLPAPFLVFDATGKPLAHNPAAVRVLGPLPASLGDLPLEASEGAQGTIIARVLRGELVTGELADLRPPEGQPQRLRVTAIPLRDGETLAGGVLMVIEAGAPPGADAVQREVMGIVGHDLRNPLSAIRMTAQLLARPAEMPTERRATLANRVLTSSGRMDSIVRSLLDYARAKGGALVRLEREGCDLSEIVRRIADEHEAAYPGRKITIEVSGDPHGDWDPGRIEQIVANLISNALRHGGEDGLAEVSIEGNGADQVRLAVHNQGPPIAPEALDRIFDPFEIGPSTAGSPRKSIGLGLFIVSQLAVAHGGRVGVRSNTDEGTTFTVDLPRNAVSVPAG